MPILKYSTADPGRDGTAPMALWAQQYSAFVFSDSEGNLLAAEDLPSRLLLRGTPVHNMVIVAKAEGAPPRTLLVHGRLVTDGGRLAAVIAVHEITRERRAERLKECERQVAELLAKPEPADRCGSPTSRPPTSSRCAPRSRFRCPAGLSCWVCWSATARTAKCPTTCVRP